MSKKQHSHLLLTLFACFVFPFFFLHIGVNLPDSVKRILWFGIRSLSKSATCVHCLTSHRKT